jgi:nucleoid-associated protein YgaU
MFLRDGTPVRSTLSVRLQEYVEVDLEIRQGLFFGSPTVSAAVSAAAATARPGLSGAETVHVTARGDTLSGLAAAYLGDAARWREIADANTVEDPFDLPPGSALVIPAPGSRRAAGQGGRPGQAGGRP